MRLSDLKEAIGDKIDLAMERCGSFDVPPAQYCDLTDVYVFQDLPRVVYFWDLVLYRSAVMDVTVTKDMENMTGTHKQRIPHKIRIKIAVIADDVDDVGGQWCADTMRDSILEEFGDHPCITHNGSGVPLLYMGFSNTPQEYTGGVYTHTFTYEGLIFLDGRSETNPLVQAVEYITHVGEEMGEEEEEGGPEPDPEAVTVSEVTHQIVPCC